MPLCKRKSQTCPTSTLTLRIHSFWPLLDSNRYVIGSFSEAPHGNPVRELSVGDIMFLSYFLVLVLNNTFLIISKLHEALRYVNRGSFMLQSVTDDVIGKYVWFATLTKKKRLVPACLEVSLYLAAHTLI